MSNWIRLGISALVSLIITVVTYLFPATFMLYFFAPGFWLGDALPASFVNALGGDLFTVYASFVIWALLFFFLIWLIARSRRRNYR